MSGKKEEGKCWIRSTVNWLRDGWPAAVAGGLIVILLISLERSLADGFWPDSGGDKDQTVLRANLGALGDIMGGFLNPFLTFISIILLIQTIRISQKTLQKTEESLAISNNTLKATKEQIELNRLELEETRKETARATEAHIEISETQKNQRKESSFYNSFERLERECSKLYKIDEHQRSIASRISKSVSSTGEENKALEIIEHYASSLEVGVFISYLIVSLERAEDNYEFDYLIDSIISEELRFFLCMCAYYMESYESITLLGAIKSGRIIKNRKVYYLYKGNGFELAEKAFSDLSVELIVQ